MAASDLPLVGSDTADVVRILLHQVGIQIVQRPSHLVGVLLINAEDEGFSEAVGLLEKLRQVTGDRLRAGTQRHHPLEVLGLILFVRNLTAIPVKITLARAPPGSIPGADDPVYPVRREKTIFNALPQAIGVNGIAEVGVSVPVVFAQRRRRHAHLVGRSKIFEDLAPVALIPGTATVTFVHDNQIKEVRGVLAVEARSAFILGKGLVDGEVHLPALVGLSILDFPASVAKGSEDLILWVVDQDVAISKVQNLGAAVLTGPVPADVPQLPANLESHD